MALTFGFQPSRRQFEPCRELCRMRVLEPGRASSAATALSEKLDEDFTDSLWVQSFGHRAIDCAGKLRGQLLLGYLPSVFCWDCRHVEPPPPACVDQPCMLEIVIGPQDGDYAYLELACQSTNRRQRLVVNHITGQYSGAELA